MRKILLVIPVALASLYTCALALTQGLSIGVDIDFHLEIASSWAHGEIGMLCPVALEMNGTPYPPLFHLILAIGVLLGFGVQWALTLQVVLLPLAVASFMYLTYRLHGSTLSFYSGVLVLGSTAYLDRVVQPQPQALDFIL